MSPVAGFERVQDYLRFLTDIARMRLRHALTGLVTRARKATIAGVVAAVGALGMSMTDAGITQEAVIAAIGIGIAAFAATWRVPNKSS